MMNTFHFIGLVGGAGAPESWRCERKCTVDFLGKFVQR
jgi:hypothetical protein